MKKLFFILMLLIPFVGFGQHRYFKDVTVTDTIFFGSDGTSRLFRSNDSILLVVQEDTTTIWRGGTQECFYINSDTLYLYNGAKIYNTHADTVYIEETVCKIKGDLLVTGNITNTPARGGSYISTAGTQTIGTGGTFEKLYEGTMAYTACCLHDFTESNGRLTYTGTLTIHMTINCNISIESGETDQIVQFRLAKNGTTIVGTNMTREFTNQNQDSCVGLNWLLEMATNDYVEVFGTSDTNADTFDINNITLSIVKN